MTIYEAITLARKNKCRIQNNGLKFKMCGQDAKSLIHWLFIDIDSPKKSKKLIKMWLKSKTWELDYEKY